MTVNLTPSSSRVEARRILNLVVKRENGTLIHQQYLTVVPFDYAEMMEEIRNSGLLKSDEILRALSELLIEREYVVPADAYVLDIGMSGRPSEALQEVCRHNRNGNHTLMKEVASRIGRSCYEFEGPEGSLPVLKTEAQEVAGHVHLCIGDNNGLYETLTLDVVGQADVDFPDDFQQQLMACFSEELTSLHPEVDWTISVHVVRSDYSVSLDSRYAQLARLDGRRRRDSLPDWLVRS